MKLNHLFSDGAVFQRRIPIPVFGTTDADSVVTITFNGKEYCGAAGTNGGFLIELEPMEAGGPYTMAIRNNRTGDAAEVRDILIGEVWLASGQSNMQFRLEESPVQRKEFEEEKLGRDDVRMFTVPCRASAVPETDVISAWHRTSDPENAPKMSAVALWYATRIQKELNVPVGILSSSWGGTIAEAWTSRNTLMRNPDCRDVLLNYRERLARKERWDKVQLKEWQAAPNAATPENMPRICGPTPENTGLANGWASPDFDDSAWKRMEIPRSWIREGINHNGTIWARIKAEIPASWAGKDLILHLGGIDKHDITYFNGEEAGRSGKDYETDYWDTKRVYSVPGKLVKAGPCVVAVRGYSFMNDGAFLGLKEDYYLELPGSAERIPLADAPVAVNKEKDIGTTTPDMLYDQKYYGPWYANTPTGLFDSMIRPLIPYGIRGVIWYQGESNADCVGKAVLYKRLIKDLITDWRFHWGLGDFPFIQVGLANLQAPRAYDEKSPWAELRQAQWEAARDMTGVGMAPAIDIGEVADIHPKNKREVAARMADWAMRHVYGKTAGIRECAPMPREVRIEGSALRIMFDMPLVLRENSGFYIAGDDGKYAPAKAVPEDNSILLTSADVPRPRHVRYAWAINPEHLTLFNRDGIPASSFEM